MIYRYADRQTRFEKFNFQAFLNEYIATIRTSGGFKEVHAEAFAPSLPLLIQ